ncbi:helix-turn-helix transcriptional regulator [Streptomyces sp. NPDC052682]|uniref:AraC family transcriptional regulator n=1 Tax=Streptomyces sp. NPDC052682 TaxID=3154954 RepID=UPI003447A213
MVDFASLPIRVLPYVPVCRPGLGLTLTTLSDLRERYGGLPDTPYRLDFHQIMLVEEGTGTLAVDSRTYHCRPGTVTWTRPNQVLHFLPRPDMEATLILFTETFPPRLDSRLEMLDDVLRPCHWQLSYVELVAFRRVVSLLRDEFEGPDRGQGGDLLRHLLAVVLLHIDQVCSWHHGGGQDVPSAARTIAGDDLFLRFRRELDRSFRTTRLVEDYATALGCTARTLSRACRTVVGQPPKELIDARVELEARRLLVHTDLPVAAIARHLGFTEATNFCKFFARRAGRSPGAFRTAAQTGELVV